MRCDRSCVRNSAPLPGQHFLVGATGPMQEERPKNQFTNFFAAHFFHSKKPCPTPPSNPSFPLSLSTGRPSHKHPHDPPTPLPNPAFQLQALLLLAPHQAATPTIALSSLPTNYPISPKCHAIARGVSTSNSTHPAPAPTTSFQYLSTGWQTTSLQLVLKYSPCVCWASMLPGLGFSSPKPLVLQMVLEVPEFYSPWPKSLVLF